MISTEIVARQLIYIKTITWKLLYLYCNQKEYQFWLSQSVAYLKNYFIILIKKRNIAMWLSCLCVYNTAHNGLKPQMLKW